MTGAQSNRRRTRDVGVYRKVYPRLWRHPGFSGLKPSTRELALYLLSGPQTNRIGLFHFSIATAGEELNVGAETLRKGLADIAVIFGWQYDSDARVFYIPSWWRWNKPENENVLKGNLKSLSDIRPCGLVEAFARNLETLPETFHQTFIEGCRIRLPKRSPNQEQYQKHLTDQEHDHGRHKTSTGDGATKLSGMANCQDGQHLLPVARQVLVVTDPTAPLEHLIDAFFSIKPSACTKETAANLINVALSEMRDSNPPASHGAGR